MHRQEPDIEVPSIIRASAAMASAWCHYHAGNFSKAVASVSFTSFFFVCDQTLVATHQQSFLRDVLNYYLADCDTKKASVEQAVKGLLPWADCLAQEISMFDKAHHDAVSAIRKLVSPESSSNADDTQCALQIAHAHDILTGFRVFTTGVAIQTRAKNIADAMAALSGTVELIKQWQYYVDSSTRVATQGQDFQYHPR
jgi:hypothetical protein